LPVELAVEKSPPKLVPVPVEEAAPLTAVPDGLKTEALTPTVTPVVARALPNSAAPAVLLVLNIPALKTPFVVVDSANTALFKAENETAPFVPVSITVSFDRGELEPSPIFPASMVPLMLEFPVC
jgi:hypothetical protein